MGKIPIFTFVRKNVNKASHIKERFVLTANKSLWSQQGRRQGGKGAGGTWPSPINMLGPQKNKRTFLKTAVSVLNFKLCPSP